MTAASEADALIALGANLGDRRTNLTNAVQLLTAAGDLRCTARSALYETHPVGGPETQGDYLNAAIRVQTTLAPHVLLHRCLEVERRLGRQRTIPNAPRTIDLDLLIYEDVIQQDPRLTLPHPRLHLRAFVLAPLVEIAPEVRHPLHRCTLAELYAALPPDPGVRRLAEAAW